MKKLRDGVEDYLALRRGLGFKLKRHGRFAREFAAAMEKRGETRITTRSAIEWATGPQQLHPSEWAARLSSVRAFARYWSTIDTSAEIPPEGLLPFRPARANPYLYTDEEIRQLLDAAKSMSAQFPLHRSTYHCLLGLLAVSGVRISEALNLFRKLHERLASDAFSRMTRYGTWLNDRKRAVALIVIAGMVAKRRSDQALLSAVAQASAELRSQPSGSHAVLSPDGIKQVEAELGFAIPVP